ncbi:MAG: GNAT family N-acetyltransferase [Bryobacteraceae bacterium]|nr:GNAT family N-acetyltransferase [Bryobacteraceae bacterium]
MPIYEINPLTDVRWGELVERHPAGALFHTSGWLEALWRTYGFESSALTTSAPSEVLENGLVFCRVNSRITGRRLVSLPYSDHCEPLTGAPEQLSLLLDDLSARISREDLRYVELRPLNAVERSASRLQLTESHVLHSLDLTTGLSALFRGFHKSSTQRKIRRAERCGLKYSAGQSELLLSQFYRLLLLTRRRHGLPPQPRLWFQNLIACFGDALTIRVASFEGRPVASILTIRHKDTLVYKYGCADHRYFPFGGMHYLLWTAIQEAVGEGVRGMDLGRSEAGHQGLITFKDRWGAARQPLRYYRLPYPGRPTREYNRGSLKRGQYWAGKAISHLPGWILDPLGRLLYRHMA